MRTWDGGGQGQHCCLGGQQVTPSAEAARGTSPEHAQAESGEDAPSFPKMPFPQDIN